MNKVKLKVSLEAYDYLKNLLVNSKDFDCFKITVNSNGCCHDRITFCADLVENKEEDEVLDWVEHIPFLYSEKLSLELISIEIILRNDRVFAKVTPINKESYCSSCAKGSSCGSGCMKCKNS